MRSSLRCVSFRVSLVFLCITLKYTPDYATDVDVLPNNFFKMIDSFFFSFVVVVFFFFIKNSGAFGTGS